MLLTTFWYFFKAKDGSSKVTAGRGGQGQGQGEGKRLVGRKLCTVTHEPECHPAFPSNNQSRAQKDPSPKSVCGPFSAIKDLALDPKPIFFLIPTLDQE